MSFKGYTVWYCGGVRWQLREDGFSQVKERLLPELSSLHFFTHRVPIKQGAKKSLWEFVLSDSQGSESYLIKCYQHRSFIARLKTLFASSKAIRELKAAVAIEARGIPTTTPVAVGERGRWGLIQEGYVVIKKLKDCQDLNHYFLKEYPSLASPQAFREKRMIISAFGILARKVHQQGIFQTDFSLNNFLLTRDEERKAHLYLSDFEKVTSTRTLSFQRRVQCLAKLNRVGREISATDRLRFLKAYQMGSSPAHIRSLAKVVQQRTIALLRADLNRGRLTNVYTDALYETCERDGMRGYYRKGYQLGDILEVIHRFDLLAKSVPSTEVTGREELHLTLNFGDKVQPLVVIRYMNHPATSALALWTRMCVLSMVGVPLAIPHVVMEIKVKGAREGYLFIPQREQEVPLGEFLKPSLDKNELSVLLGVLVKLMKRLHHFGTFADKISESYFMVVRKHDGTPSLHLKSVERFEIRKEVSLSDKRRELVLLSALIKKHYPTITFDLTQRYFKAGRGSVVRLEGSG